MPRIGKSIALCWVLALLSSVCFADDENVIRGERERYSIQGRISLPKTAGISTSTRILVDGGEFVGIPLADGSFTITNVPPGTYLVEVHHIDYVFPPIRVDISAKQKGKTTAVIQSTKVKVSYPLVLKPDKPASYFQVHVPYDWSSLLKNPMILMMGFTVIMVVVMPRMLSGMDPKELEAMRKTGLKDLLTGNVQVPPRE